MLNMDIVYTCIWSHVQWCHLHYHDEQFLTLHVLSCCRSIYALPPYCMDFSILRRGHAVARSLFSPLIFLLHYSCTYSSVDAFSQVSILAMILNCYNNYDNIVPFLKYWCGDWNFHLPLELFCKLPCQSFGPCFSQLAEGSIGNTRQMWAFGICFSKNWQKLRTQFLDGFWIKLGVEFLMIDILASSL